jgi:hypothetical protein
MILLGSVMTVATPEELKLKNLLKAGRTV